MNTKQIYAHEKLGEAVQVLATHPGRVKERLIEAMNRTLHAVDPNDLPSEPRRIWNERVWKPLTSVQDQQRGSAAASLENLSDDQACQIAQSICTVDAMVEHDLRP